MNNQKIGLLLKILLLVFAIGWLIFSLMSGFEQSGGFRNLPNGLPWLVMLVLVLIAFKWEIAGAAMLVLYGIFTVLFYSFGLVFFIISLPIIVLGLILLWLSLKI